MGRPTLCTPEITAAIVAYLEEGIAFKTACEAEGISEQDGYNWLKWGDGDDEREPYSSFFLAITRAKPKGEISLHRQALAGGKGSSMAGWVLERRFREHYGPPTKDSEPQVVEIILKGGLPEKPTEQNEGVTPSGEPAC